MYTCGFRINVKLVKKGSFRINAKMVKEELNASNICFNPSGRNKNSLVAELQLQNYILPLWTTVVDGNLQKIYHIRGVYHARFLQMTTPIIHVGYDLYFLTDLEKTMQIDMVYHKIKDVNVVFYDGQGEKSHILLQISDSEHSNTTSVLTTAYLAMILFNRLTNFTMKMIQLWNIANLCAWTIQIIK